MGRLLTAADIAGLSASELAGGLVLSVGDRISPQALDVARERGVRVEWGSVGSDEIRSGGAALDVAGVEDQVTARVRDAVRRVLVTADGVSPDDVVEQVLRELAGSAGAAGGTVTQRLASFVLATARDGLPPHVLHETKRLVLNDLKASLRAHDHPFVSTLLKQAQRRVPDPQHRATVLWRGEQVDADDAALINTVLFEILDFNETYVPTYVHMAPAVLGAALAAAQVYQCDGRRMLTALAIGVEVEIAISIMIMPTAYERGYLPGVISGRVGAAAASAAIVGLNHEQTVAALAYAMLSGGGLFEGVGSTVIAWVKGEAARAGFVAAQLAASGADAPVTAFEGAKGMLGAYGKLNDPRCDVIIDSLGSTWRTLEASYKRYQAETIDQAPLQALLAVRARAEGKVSSVTRICFDVDPLVASIAAERYARFGSPSTDLQATFDLRYVMAAAWITGRTGDDIYTSVKYRDAAILALRSQIEVRGQPGRELDGARVEVSYTDGTVDVEDVVSFIGSPCKPLTDDELTDLFAGVAEERVAPSRVAAILRSVEQLERSPSVEEVVSSVVMGR